MPTLQHSSETVFVSAASPRLVSTEYPRRGCRDASPRTIHVPAAASPTSPRTIHVPAAASPARSGSRPRRYVIGGSFRRGQPDCGDVDVCIFHPAFRDAPPGADGPAPIDDGASAARSVETSKPGGAPSTSDAGSGLPAEDYDFGAARSRPAREALLEALRAKLHEDRFLTDDLNGMGGEIKAKRAVGLPAQTVGDVPRGRAEIFVSETSYLSRRSFHGISTSWPRRRRDPPPRKTSTD